MTFSRKESPTRVLYLHMKLCLITTSQ